jgi:hypothetical protein
MSETFKTLENPITNFKKWQIHFLLLEYPQKSKENQARNWMPREPTWITLFLETMDRRNSPICSAESKM